MNVYGRSKVAAEQFISANYSNFAILRSSIIYGPQTVSPVPKSLPVQVNTMNFTLFLHLSNFIIELLLFSRMCGPIVVSMLFLLCDLEFKHYISSFEA